MGWMRDETGLDKTPANYVPLTPLSHLARAAKVFPDREALVYGDMRLTYRDYGQAGRDDVGFRLARYAE